MKRLAAYGLLLALALLIAVTPGMLAQSGGAFTLTWNVVVSGGGPMTGGAYSLTGSAGQPAAGSVATGGPYSLSGGVWGDMDSSTGGSDTVRVYLPQVVR
jgi:hypothetical protein